MTTPRLDPTAAVVTEEPDEEYVFDLKRAERVANRSRSNVDLRENLAEALAEVERLRDAVTAAEGLVKSWLARIPHHSGGFYPEAHAYDDGKDAATDACADELTDALAKAKAAE